MSTTLARRLFTVAEYEQLAAAGILAEDERAELIDGEIFTMPPIGEDHARATNRATRYFFQTLSEDYLISVQNPLRLSEYRELYPDLLVARETGKGIPNASEALLVVEVADSTRHTDRGTKLALYADAGIPEVWLIDLVAGIVERYNDPLDGSYRQLQSFRRGEIVSSRSVPLLHPSVDLLLS
jgi:Uma2 family endonuclease